MRRAHTLTLALFAASAYASAQTPNQSPAAKLPAACSAPEFRQFDFWVGAWAVKNSGGREAGKNEITRVADGCAIREQWTGAGGMSGISLNYYDKRSGKWNQDWVGGDGVLLHLSGGLDRGAMVLSGEREGPQGRMTDRISWTPLQDGRVQQEWSTSADGGKSWKVVFLGFYVRQ